MKLSFYTADYTAKILREIPQLFEKYLSYEIGKLSDHVGYSDPVINESSIEIRSIPRLSVDHAKPESDADASIIIHKAFQLPRSVAKDRRLWLHLSYEYYSEYLYKRWGLADKSLAVFKERVGLNTGLAGLAGHGLARLWWAAELSYLHQETGDPYRLVHTAFSTQQTHQSLFESQICVSERLLRLILESLGKLFHKIDNHSPDCLEKVSKSEIVKLFAKELNSWARVDIVETLTPEEMDRFCMTVYKELAEDS